ncbi:MAG: N-6 DNA methylase [Thermaceae bacterium]|nr:N-6 DNA methylase [Thermaceae bacterium]
MALHLPDGPTGEVAKRLGAYYTSLPVAEFLVRWALQSPNDRVLDPSFGGGVFLYAASQRLKELGGKPQKQVFGVELDAEVHARTARILAEGFRVGNSSLAHGDFFDVDANTFGSPEVIVGNPPFIRYQRFTGAGRDKALKRAAAEGVHLSKLASSWAPFLVHSAALLKDGGRIGMVIPMELGHAAYARPVLEYLAGRFEQVRFLTFRKKLFPDLSQDVLLLLAENKGWFEASFHTLDLENAEALARLRTPLKRAKKLETRELSSGKERLLEGWIPRKARELYRELRDSARVQRLGQIADVGIGYVTGDNQYFHLSPQQARELKIPKTFLKPAIRRSRALAGLRLTQQDWQKAEQYLFYVNGAKELPDTVLNYIEQGETNGVHLAYKCRVRKPWYSVLHVYLPAAFLTYMSGETPWLVANNASVVAPNTLHVLRLHPGAEVSSEGLSALWQTSLTRLSAELEGHAMGGGMLKLEPTEAERVVIAKPNLNGSLGALAHDLDALHRAGKGKEGLEQADRTVLRDSLGLSKRDCDLLSGAAQSLRERRQNR